MPEPASTATVLCHSPTGTTHTVPVSALQWRPAAYAIVLHPTTGKLLTLRQFTTKHDLPGGGVELNEHPPDAAVRETREETGVRVANPVLLGVESAFFRAGHADGGCYHSLLFYYACEFVGDAGQGPEGLDEWERGYVDGVEWVDAEGEELAKLEVGSTVDWRKYVRLARGGG